MTREFYTGEQVNCSVCGAGSGLFLTKQAQKKGLCDTCNGVTFPQNRHHRRMKTRK